METTELALAAYLQVLGHKLKDIVPKNGSQVSFVFEDNDKIAEDLVKYSSSDFARYDAALRSLRRIVYTKIKRR